MSARNGGHGTLPQSSSNSPPADGEVEISVFGPGRGESVVVHIGGGEWIIVDSCMNLQDRTNPALTYLADIGVDVASQVKLVVGTHAHDDHINGLASIFEASSSARLVIASAATSEEFLAQVESDLDVETQLRIRIRNEYKRLLDEVDRRPRPGLLAYPGRDLWLRKEVGAVPAARVRSLSPSDEATARAKRILASGLAKASDRRRLSTADPNEFAIALWIEVGDVTVLLGADLENGPAMCGWQAVLDEFTPDEAASLFKVPHHGSPNAHHDEVWAHLLEPGPVAILAPYRAGQTPRPAPDDIARILSLTSDAYITADPKKPVPKGVRRAARKLTTVARTVSDPWGIPGQVRARREIGAVGWTIELYKPARALQDART